jgi:hypothetical protein
MAGEFLAGIKLDIDYSSVDAFLTSIKTAVDKLNALKDEGDGSKGDAAALEGAGRSGRSRSTGPTDVVSSNPDDERRHREMLNSQRQHAQALEENTKAHKSSRGAASSGSQTSSQEEDLRRLLISPVTAGAAVTLEDQMNKAKGSVSSGARPRPVADTSPEILGRLLRERQTLSGGGGNSPPPPRPPVVPLASGGDDDERRSAREGRRATVELSSSEWVDARIEAANESALRTNALRGAPGGVAALSQDKAAQANLGSDVNASSFPQRDVEARARELIQRNRFNTDVENTRRSALGQPSLEQEAQAKTEAAAQAAQAKAERDQARPYASINSRLDNFKQGPSSSAKDPYASVNSNIDNFRSMATSSSAWKTAADSTTVAQKNLADALNRDAKAGGRGGSFYQQFQGATHDSDHNVAAGRQNTDYQTLGQTAASHAARALSYVGPGLAIGAGIEELRDSVQQAEAAQIALREVEAEFTALGQASQFEGFSNSIKDIASNTGLATSEVAELGLAMKGVFGNTQQAEIALNGIAQGAVAMGLDLQEAQQDVTAITQSFTGLEKQGGAAVQTVTNEMLHLQDYTGVSSKNLLSGVADVAPSANNVGLNLNQTSSMVAAASQRSGQDPTVIGQTLAKLIDGLTQNFGQIYSAFGSSSSTSGLLPQLGKGKSIGADIPTILKGLGELPVAEQQQITQSLGINASAQPSLNALITSSGKAAQLARTTTPADRTTEEFNLQEKTIGQTMDRLRQDFVNLGVSIVNSGIGTALSDTADGIGDVVKSVDPLVHGLGDMNSALGGIPAKIGLLIVSLLAMRAAITAVTSTEVGGTAAAGVSGAVAGVRDVGLVGGLSNVGAGAGDALLSAPTLGMGTILPGALAGAAGYGIGTEVYDNFLKNNKTYNSLASKYAHLMFGYNSGAKTLAYDESDAGRYKASDAAAQRMFAERGAHVGDGPVNVGADNTAAADLATTSLDKRGSAQYDSDFKKLQDAERAAGLRVAQSTKVTSKAVDDKTAQYKYDITDYAGAQSAYQAGQESFNKLVSAARFAENAARQAFNTTPNQQNFEALEAATLATNQLLDQQTTATQAQQQSIQKTGSPAQDIANVAANIKDIKKDKTPAGKLTSATAALAAGSQAEQDAAALAPTLLQQNAILAAGYTYSAAQSKAINAALVAAGQAPDPTNARGQITSGGQTIGLDQKLAALQQPVQASEALAVANANENPMAVLQAQLSAAQTTVQQNASIYGTNSPQYTTAVAAVKTLNSQVADQMNAIIQANLGLLSASTANDPVQSAQYALQQAQAAYANAASHGDAAGMATAATQIAQDQTTVNANVIAQAQAVSSITQASLTAAGDPIGAAVAAYQSALQTTATRLAQDKAMGVNPAGDTQYKTDIAAAISAQSNILTTQFSTLQTTTQEQLYLGQITANQAISQLEAGMQAAQGNQQLVLQYQQAIRQLQNSAGSNANFNIPTNLLVNPTLYQAARVNAGGGAAYNDNRQVTVTINVNNSTQTAGAVSALVQAVGGASTTGTVGPLVGAN